MLDFAAKADGVALYRGEEGPAGFGDIARKAEVAHAIGGFGKLAQELARRFKGAMDVPQGAGPAEAGELQAGGRMALGDVAGHVDPAEEERHPARILALQGGEAVAGLFKADAELLGQPVNIVAHGPRRAAKAAIGHQQGPGGIIAQADEQQLAAGRAAQRRAFDHGGNLVLQGQGGQLVCQLEPPGLNRLAGIDRQVAHFRVIGPQPRLPRIDQRNGQRALQIALNRRRIGGRGAKPGGQVLGRAVQAVDVIVGQVEPVAHFFPGQAGHAARFARQRLVHHLQPLARTAIGFVQGNEPLGQSWLLLGKAGQLGGIQRFGKQRIGIGFAQGSQPGFGIARANLAPVKREGAAQPLDQPRGQRPVIVLQLREVRGADRQPCGQLSLLKAMLGTDGPQARSGKQAARCHNCPFGPLALSLPKGCSVLLRGFRRTKDGPSTGSGRAGLWSGL